MPSAARRHHFEPLSTFPKYTRFVDSAPDMVRVVRGEKPTDFTYDHDLRVQAAVLQASGLPRDQ